MKVGRAEERVLRDGGEIGVVIQTRLRSFLFLSTADCERTG